MEKWTVNRLLKNKGSTYFLIPIALTIWGIIIWKFDNYSKNIPISTPQNTISHSSPYLKRDFNPDFNYPDPFLKSKKLISNLPKRTPKILKLNEPSFKLRGSINNNNIVLAVVEFKNSYLLLQEGDTVDQFILLKNLADSLILQKFFDETHYVVK